MISIKKNGKLSLCQITCSHQKKIFCKRSWEFEIWSPDWHMMEVLTLRILLKTSQVKLQSGTFDEVLLPWDTCETSLSRFQIIPGQFSLRTLAVVKMNLTQSPVEKMSLYHQFKIQLWTDIQINSHDLDLKLVLAGAWACDALRDPPVELMPRNW